MPVSLMAQSSWVGEATHDNGAATITIDAVPGMSHYLTGWDVTYSTAKTGALAHTLEYTPQGFDTPVTLTFHENYSVKDGRWPLGGTLACQLNTPVVFTAAASGAGGNVGWAHLWGATV